MKLNFRQVAGDFSSEIIVTFLWNESHCQMTCKKSQKSVHSPFRLPCPCAQAADPTRSNALPDKGYYATICAGCGTFIPSLLASLTDCIRLKNGPNFLNIGFRAISYRSLLPHRKGAYSSHSEVLYGTWTENVPHDLADAGATADPARLATDDHHCGGTCPPGADHSPPGRWRADLPDC